MHIDVYLQKISNLFAENRLLKFVVIVQAAVLIWCVAKVEDIKDKVRTVIQPPVIHSKVEVSGSWTSDSYVREYIRYLGALLWNYSPATARSQFGELLASWHPSNFEDAKQQLYILADRIEQTKSASVFYINKVENNPDKHTIEVTGNRHLTMQDKSVENVIKTYLVTYKVENGRFWVLGVDEKDKKAAAPVAQPQTAQNPGGSANAKP